MSTFKAARMLGWTSLAVGITEIVATSWLEEQMGVDNHHTLIRSFGVREIAAGGMILSDPGLTRPVVAGLWARVLGDAADLATLGGAVRSTRNPKGLATIIGIVLAITGLDVIVASLAQAELGKARVVSARARQRVQPTVANPNGSVEVIISDAARAKMERESVEQEKQAVQS